MGGGVVEHGQMCLCCHAPWGNSLREPLFCFVVCFVLLGVFFLCSAAAAMIHCLVSEREGEMRADSTE